MEIACHGVTHPFLDHLPASVCAQEVLEDRKRLEEVYGGIVRGLAYPFGTYNADVITALKACGIAYARTIVSTEKFDLPQDWLQWHGTCHHGNPKLMKLAQRFVEDKRNWTPMVFYLWGHSYEFDNNDNWDRIEAILQILAGREDTWYPTNIQLRDYVAAYESLIFSADGNLIYNPTLQEIWLNVDGTGHSIKPGETLTLT